VNGRKRKGKGKYIRPNTDVYKGDFVFCVPDFDVSGCDGKGQLT